jgi:non-specific protein-tyrosine kinase
VRNTAIATFVGGIAGVGIAFLLDYLDDTIHTPEDAREILGVNALGAIPDVATAETIGWLALAQPLSPVAEAFRNLRTSLQYTSLDAPLRTLLVSSTEPDEGKTFVASNVATVFALAGKRVLLFEADLRRPRLHKLWDRGRSPGLTEALRDYSEASSEGDTDVSPSHAYIQATQVENLDLLTAGTEISTPAELLSSQTFRRMLEKLLETYDLIVLDTPPVLTVTDAAILATLVDGVVMVTVSGQTRLPSAERAIERFQAVGSHLLGLVVNRLTARSGGYYYHYYHYSSSYAYGDGRERDSGNGRGPHRDGRRSEEIAGNLSSERDA